MKQHPAGGRQSPKSEIRRSKEIRSPKAEIPLGETKSELGRKEWNSSDFELRNSFGLRASDFGLLAARDFHKRLLDHAALVSGPWRRGTCAGALNHAGLVVSTGA